MDMLEHFGKIFQEGSTRAGIKKCSEWTEKYVYQADPRDKTKIRPTKWTYYPWSKDMHDAEGDFIIGMKAAQMAYTNVVLDQTLYQIDMLGSSCLYVMPTQHPVASDFSSGRLHKLLISSPYLSTLFTSGSNVGHKMAGTRELWIRGSSSESGLTNIDPDFLALDEFDRMDQKGVAMALRRSDGQWRTKTWMISTPTLPETGIHAEWLQSKQEHWRFKCPVCSQICQLHFPDCLKVCGDGLNDPDLLRSHVICDRCKKPIRHEEKIEAQNKTGRWEADEPGSTSRGFGINHLYSCQREPFKIARQAIEAQYSKSKEQEYWNQAGGLPHIVDGAKLTDTDILGCRVGRKMDESWPPHIRVRTMGVDVGKVFHYTIDGWTYDKPDRDLNLATSCDVLRAGFCDSLTEIRQLMYRYQVAMTVIDYQPEERLVYEFCSQNRGTTLRCQYAAGESGSKMSLKTEDETKVNIHRNHWLDLRLGRFTTGRIRLPRDISEEYVVHHKNIVKHFSEDKHGSVSKDKSEYKKQGADHLAHSGAYSEVAFAVAASRSANVPYRSVL